MQQGERAELGTFEEGLEMLLKTTYEKPSIRPDFRDQLLGQLKERQRERSMSRRRKVLVLYSSVTAAAAALVLVALPVLSAATPVHSGGNGQTVLAQRAVSMPEAQPASFSPLSLDPTCDTTTAFASSNVNGQPLFNFAGRTARAVNAVDVAEPSTGAWRTVASGETFALENGTRFRTPIGSLNEISVEIDKGPTVMLDGMSQMKICAGELRLEDGNALVSVTGGDQPVGLRLAGQDVELLPGTMAFMHLEDGEGYADGGAPAPVLVLLKGQGQTLDAHKTPLLAGQVYELYETGTGKFPTRPLGAYEREQRFQPMVNAIMAANEY